MQACLFVCGLAVLGVDTRSVEVVSRPRITVDSLVGDVEVTAGEAGRVSVEAVATGEGFAAILERTDAGHRRSQVTLSRGRCTSMRA